MNPLEFIAASKQFCSYFDKSKTDKFKWWFRLFFAAMPRYYYAWVMYGYKKYKCWFVKHLLN